MCWAWRCASGNAPHRPSRLVDHRRGAEDLLHQRPVPLHGGRVDLADAAEHLAVPDVVHPAQRAPLEVARGERQVGPGLRRVLAERQARLPDVEPREALGQLRPGQPLGVGVRVEAQLAAGSPSGRSRGTRGRWRLRSTRQSAIVREGEGAPRGRAQMAGLRVPPAPRHEVRGVEALAVVAAPDDVGGLAPPLRKGNEPLDRVADHLVAAVDGAERRVEDAVVRVVGVDQPDVALVPRSCACSGRCSRRCPCSSRRSPPATGRAAGRQGPGRRSRGFRRRRCRGLRSVPPVRPPRCRPSCLLRARGRASPRR